MKENMVGEYRLFRQGGGRAAFAHVFIEVCKWDGLGCQCIISLDLENELMLDRELDKIFLDAAIEGCNNSLDVIRIEGIDTSKYKLIVVRVLINITDTTVNAIMAAAFFAALNAFGLDDQFKLIFSENKWQAIHI